MPLVWPTAGALPEAREVRQGDDVGKTPEVVRGARWG